MKLPKLYMKANVYMYSDREKNVAKMKTRDCDPTLSFSLLTNRKSTIRMRIQTIVIIIKLFFCFI